jgi:hypothetical protein
MEDKILTIEILFQIETYIERLRYFKIETYWQVATDFLTIRATVFTAFKIWAAF